jgi:hypothetical protein
VTLGSGFPFLEKAEDFLNTHDYGVRLKQRMNVVISALNKKRKKEFNTVAIADIWNAYNVTSILNLFDKCF